MPIVNCPACDEELDLAEEHRDWTVSCPHCDHRFVPSETRGRSHKEEEEEGESDGYVYGYEAPTRNDAYAIVRTPAICMEILGWGGIVVIFVACLVAFILTVEGGNVNDDTLVLWVLIALAAVLGLPCSFVIAWGGRHMRNLTSHGWALTAGIICIVFGVFLFAMFCCFGIFHIPVGIWAVVVTQDTKVLRAFRTAHQRR